MMKAGSHGIDRMERNLRFALAVTLVLFFCATCAGPAAISRLKGDSAPTLVRLDGERRTFSIDEGEGIELTVPSGWKVRPTKGGPDLPLSLRLDPPGGGALFLVPSVIEEGPEAPDPLESARLFALIARRRALEGGADPNLPIQKLEHGDDDRVHGFFFIANDKKFVKPAPGVEHWPDMLRGAAAIGRLLVTFTWFDEGPGASREKVLDLMRGAQQVVPKEAQAKEAQTEEQGQKEEQAPLSLKPAPEILTTPLAVAAPGGAFAVLVDLPGFKMYEPRPNPDGEGMLLVGQHPKTGFVASVTVLPKEASADADACRAEKLKSLKATAHDLTDLTLSEVGVAARARYVLHDLKGEKVRQDHAHAFLARDGSCIDVHLSKAAPSPGDDARIEAILATVRFAEEL